MLKRSRAYAVNWIWGKANRPLTMMHNLARSGGEIIYPVYYSARLNQIRKDYLSGIWLTFIKFFFKQDWYKQQLEKRLKKACRNAIKRNLSSRDHSLEMSHQLTTMLLTKEALGEFVSKVNEQNIKFNTDKLKSVQAQKPTSSKPANYIIGGKRTFMRPVQRQPRESGQLNSANQKTSHNHEHTIRRLSLRQ